MPPPFLYAALGFITLGFQTLLLREGITASGGNEIALASLFFFWFIGIAIGAILSVRVKAKAFPAWLTFTIFFYLLWGLLARGIRHILPLPPGTLPDIWIILLMGFLLMFLPGFLSGFLFPTAIAWKNPSIQEVFFYEAFGSFLAGTLLTFILIPHFQGLAQLLILLSIPLGLTGKIPRIIGVAIFLLALPPWQNPLNHSLEQWRFASFSRGITFLEAHTTPYAHIALGEWGEQRQLYIHGIFTKAFPDPWTEETTYRPLLAFAHDPQHILVLGGIPGEMDKALSWRRLKVLDHVLLDPWLIDHLAKNLPSTVHFFSEDPRRFLRGKHQRYDLIVSVFPLPASLQGNRYFTHEYFQLIRNLLNPQGLVALSLSGTVNYLSPMMQSFLGSIARAFQETFPHVRFLPGIPIWFLGSPSPIPMDLKTLTHRWEKRGLTTQISQPAQLAMRMQPTHLAYLKKKLKEAQSSPNTDGMPRGFIHALLFQAYRQGRRPWVLEKMLKLPPWTPFLIIAFLFLGTRIISLRKKATLSLVFLAGFLGMAGSLLLQGVFQGKVGILFQQIGFLNACFMLGLFLGGRFAHRFTLTWAMLGMILIWGLILLGPGDKAWAYYLLELLLGLVTALPFPLVGKILGDDPQAARLVEVADHCGAGLGSLFSLLIFLPLAGFSGTLLGCFALACLGFIMEALKKTFPV